MQKERLKLTKLLFEGAAEFGVALLSQRFVFTLGTQSLFTSFYLHIFLLYILGYMSLQAAHLSGLQVTIIGE